MSSNLNALQTFDSVSGDVVLITGATGHIGFIVLQLALKAGYSVRAAVRSQEKADSLSSSPLIKALEPASRLSFVIVPDLSAPSAYDEAAQGAKYVIHLASPIPMKGYTAPEDCERVFVIPAIKGTLEMLEAAKRSGTVQRVVITSSVIALMTFKDFSQGGNAATFTADSRVPTPPNLYSGDFEAYAASKVAALNESEAWMARETLAFDLVNIMPSFVFGRNNLVTDVKDVVSGSNSALLSFLLGNKAESPLGGHSVHVDDVARTHLLALNPNVGGNQSFVTSAQTPNGMVWEDAFKFVAVHFPAAVAGGTLPCNGSQPTYDQKVDSSKTEEVFGFKHQSYEEQVKSAVGHYLELAAKA
ncbi:hypothetical protein B0A49_07626 [Cryomyces minteri]|uniref:NAD-dependent epimerase/dehydratase domain-containing protein n=1 Tax=Cryomyces minteri TaxID=331657 RepID=A0A4U0WY87_9PEZI|nr:hypothetical protein B0A49_07626 [Cryomyces minteri]